MYYQQPFNSIEQPMMGGGFMPMEHPSIRYDNKGAELIEEAARREQRMVCYDEKIMDGCKEEIDRRRIHQISLNQRKHQKMFGEIYQGMTGRKLSVNIKEPILQDDFRINIDQRIFQGFECIELYRKIYFTVIPVEWKQMMYEIIGDEQNDILKYIYYSYKN